MSQAVGPESVSGETASVDSSAGEWTDPLAASAVTPATSGSASGPPAAKAAVPEGPTDAILYAEDLHVGDSWTTDFREISAEDVQQFADLTGDHTGLHGENAAASPYGKPIAHGLLGLSVLAGLGTNHPNASTLAFVSVENWEFLAPVFFGDQVQARNEIVEIHRHGRRAIKVRWLRQLLNAEGRVLQQGHFITLVGSKSRTKKPR